MQPLLRQGQGSRRLEGNGGRERRVPRLSRTQGTGIVYSVLVRVGSSAARLPESAKSVERIVELIILRQGVGMRGTRIEERARRPGVNRTLTAMTCGNIHIFATTVYNHDALPTRNSNEAFVYLK